MAGRERDGGRRRRRRESGCRAVCNRRKQSAETRGSDGQYLSLPVTGGPHVNACVCTLHDCRKQEVGCSHAACPAISASRTVPACTRSLSVARRERNREICLLARHSSVTRNISPSLTHARTQYTLYHTHVHTHTRIGTSFHFHHRLSLYPQTLSSFPPFPPNIEEERKEKEIRETLNRGKGEERLTTTAADEDPQ